MKDSQPANQKKKLKKNKITKTVFYSSKAAKNKKKAKELKKDKKTEVNRKTDFIPLTGWHILPLISLFIILLVLTVFNAAIKQSIVNKSVISSSPIKIEAYPFINKIYAPQISAESAIIYDDTAKVVLYEKKPELRFSMASTTKIMTAIVAMEYFKFNDVITIQNINNEGAIVGFPVGEQILFEDILYALLLPSANDAAFAIAESYPGGMPAFVNKMNEKAVELNLKLTHYADPSGLDDDGNYTTVVDLAKLTSYALSNHEIAKIISTKDKTISTLKGSKVYHLKNLNKLLGEYGVIGVKTGFTQGAGEVLITAKYEKEHLFIIIVMKSQDRFADSETLLKYITNNVNFINPSEYLLINEAKKNL